MTWTTVTRQSSPHLAQLHIIESPAPADLFDGRTEGRVLSEALTLMGVPSVYRLATDREQFARAIGEIKFSMGDDVPYLHISAHGDDAALGLTNGEALIWPRFGELVSPIHQSMRAVGLPGLRVFLSCCNGAAAIMACHRNEAAFHSLVAHPGPVRWVDAAVGFTAFYHRLFRDPGTPTGVLLTALRQASGDNGFDAYSGEAMAEAFRAGETPDAEPLYELYREVLATGTGL